MSGRAIKRAFWPFSGVKREEPRILTLGDVPALVRELQANRQHKKMLYGFHALGSSADVPEEKRLAARGMFADLIQLKAMANGYQVPVGLADSVVETYFDDTDSAYPSHKSASYLAGFSKSAEEHGIDPIVLMKYAAAGDIANAGFNSMMMGAGAPRYFENGTSQVRPSGEIRDQLNRQATGAVIGTAAGLAAVSPVAAGAVSSAGRALSAARPVAARMASRAGRSVGRALFGGPWRTFSTLAMADSALWAADKPLSELNEAVDRISDARHDVAVGNDPRNDLAAAMSAARSAFSKMPTDRIQTGKKRIQDIMPDWLRHTYDKASFMPVARYVTRGVSEGYNRAANYGDGVRRSVWEGVKRAPRSSDTIRRWFSSASDLPGSGGASAGGR